MLLELHEETGEAIAIRADVMDAVLEGFFVALEDMSLDCAPDSRVVEVRSPEKWSDLLRQRPELGAGTGEWSLTDAPVRLTQAPRLVIGADIRFDQPSTLIACSIRLLPDATLIIPAGGQARVVTLKFENAGGEIRSETTSFDKPFTVGAGTRGENHDRGERRGCSGTEHGGDGRPGEDGQVGAAGSSGGTLLLAALSVEGPLRVNLSGGPGGVGGDGGQGGRGGNGAGASSGSSSLFDCRCGGSPGGRGGDGGRGGRGGRGGDGGNGGLLRLITTADLDPTSRIVMKGGIGGSGGQGGTGGEPGEGGHESGGTGFCSGQRGGSDGRPGDRGPAGEEGRLGADGRLELSILRTATGKPNFAEFVDVLLDSPAFDMTSSLTED